MPFQVSPGVNVSEIDLTTIVPAVSTTEGAIAINASWGPVDQRVLVDSEDRLINIYHKPNSNTATDFFTAANFLSYGNALYVNRAVSANAFNATAGADSEIRVKNEDHYNEDYILNANTSAGDWIAKYPGKMGNSLKVSTCFNEHGWSTDFSNTMVYTTNLGDASVTFDTAAMLDEFVVGDTVTLGLKVNGEMEANSGTFTVKSISNTSLTMTTPVPYHVALANNGLVRTWEYADLFDNSPLSTAYATAHDSANDAIHIVVVDEGGEFTGAPGTVIEKYDTLSLAVDGKTEQGAGNYYKEVINQRSPYIWWNDKAHTTSGGSIVVGNASFSDNTSSAQTTRLKFGHDGAKVSAAQKVPFYDLFKSAEDVDISFLLGGESDITLAKHLITNIAESRKDCIAVISPERDSVVENKAYSGKERDDIIEYRNTLPSSSYAVMDSGWKYQYDKYNDLYRYVPLNGDTAGLMVQTDNTRDPWWSPAGFNRGNIKNSIKLAYNPSKADRDQLYKKGVNPVVTFPGQGTVLFGDKTMLAKPSAFDRINVRRLFIVLEKAISTASKFTLFEFNDEFTRSQFRNMVEPFLRDVQGRRGITDFRVVCDNTNNTGEVIDRNEFIGDIYIKPARSINFIQLNFVAVRTGVEFSEVVGKFG